MSTPEQIDSVVTPVAAAEFTVGQLTVGTAATRFGTAATALHEGVTITAHDANGSVCYWGTASALTTAASSDQLPVGVKVFVPINDLSLIYLIANGASQTVTYYAK